MDYELIVEKINSKLCRLNGVDLLNRRLAISLGLLGLSIPFLYHSTFGWLLNQWLTDRVYSHGFIVPLISLYLVWIKREELIKLNPEPGYLFGGLALLLSGMLLLVGRVGAIVQIEAVSLLLLLPGIILFIWGWAHLKALFLPLFYLQFMVPWMDIFLERIQWPFQLLSAEIGSWLLKVMGYSVFHNKILIQLPKITLLVATQCSGVNFLISVIAIGLPLVYITQSTWWRGMFVLAVGCVITVLANGARVAIAGIMGSHYGLEMLHGPGHIFRGWFIAQVGWVGVFLVNWAVLKFPSRSRFRLYERWKAYNTKRQETNAQSATARPVVIVLLFLFGLGVYMHGFAMPRPISPKQTLATFPFKLGEWMGHESAWLKSNRFFLGMDRELIRTYKSLSGQEVNLYVGYLESQHKVKRLISFHDKPLYKRSLVVSTGLGSSGPQTVNKTRLTIDYSPYELVFWYWFPSGELIGRYQAKLKTISDALIHRRNNGAVILLATPLGDKADSVSISADLLAFLQVVTPTLREYLQ